MLSNPRRQAEVLYTVLLLVNSKTANKAPLPLGNTALRRTLQHSAAQHSTVQQDDYIASKGIAATGNTKVASAL